MQETNVKITTADPSALGLFGLAMVTIVASSQKMGWTGPGVSLIVPWAIFLGGMAQLIAGMIDMKKNNVFGATAFCAYGFFWMGVAATWLTNLGVFGESMKAAADMNQLGVAYIGYLIFSMYMFVASLRTNKVLMTAFGLINVLLIALALSTFGIAHDLMHTVGAVTELLIAFVSFYGSAGCVLNATYGKVILPMGKPLNVFQ